MTGSRFDSFKFIMWFSKFSVCQLPSIIFELDKYGDFSKEPVTFSDSCNTVLILVLFYSECISCIVIRVPFPLEFTAIDGLLFTPMMVSWKSALGGSLFDFALFLVDIINDIGSLADSLLFELTLVSCK